ncbi:MAG: NADH:ubiquinone oxidoreductase [Vulcanimicrobiaceae bacterium]
MTWVVRGLRRGILTTRYPDRPDPMPTAFRGIATALVASAMSQHNGSQACLSGAIAAGHQRATIDELRCFQCGNCERFAPDAFKMSSSFELARFADGDGAVRARLRERTAAFGRAVNIRHVDAGSDGSEEHELQAIFNPFYDANRLGIFLTPTPRHADVLIVTGVVTRAMVAPLQLAYEAMPEPKVVVALGTSACSGGIFAGSDRVAGPVDRVVPVDVLVPGTPPAPLTILHALWLALGRSVEPRRPGDTR